MNYMVIKKVLTEVLIKLKNEGLTTYIVDSDNAYYGYIVTENNNLLTIGESFGGMKISLCYPQQDGFGNACECHKEILNFKAIDKNLILELERNGLANAANLHVPKLFSEPIKEYIEICWNKDKIKKL